MLTGLIRRASSAFLGSSDDDSDVDGSSGSHRRRRGGGTGTSPVRGGVDFAAADDGEIVYCKNNVCVHPPVPLRSDPEHRPGYLVIRMHSSDEGSHPTLILNWIPNTALRKNPLSAEQRTSNLTRSSACPSPVRRSLSHGSPTSLPYGSENGHQRRSSRSGEHGTTDAMPPKGKSTPFAHVSNGSLNAPLPSWDAAASCDDIDRPMAAIGPAEVCEALEAMITGLNDIDEPAVADSNEIAAAIPTVARRKDLKLVLERDPPDISVTADASFDSTDASDRRKGDRDDRVSDARPSTCPPKLCSCCMEGTPESLAAAHKLHFPESTTGRPASGGCDTPSPSQAATGQPCSLFSVDLAQMRSLRLFFSNRECTCGQLVVASRESQYKILHFHHGGLDRLAVELDKWDLFVASRATKGDPGCPYRQFSISRPQITQEECHPEENQYGVVDEEQWMSYFNEDGQIEEEFLLRKAIFFGGLDPRLRRAIWPFLLHHHPFMSTYDERQQIRQDRCVEYRAIRSKREAMTPAEEEAFWRNTMCTVEKDVVRTDRTNPFYAGDDNPNLEVMRNILLNYAVYNPTMGYTQGMSDLLAPLLAEVQDESDTFWCFVGLMLRTIFISSPKDNDMDKHLNYIRELIRLMLPKFYSHLHKHLDAMELLFCHRWILLCFKREFPEADALRMWESCWAHYQTDYFHLFLCVAIMAIYSDDVIEQGMNTDEMLLYFSSLSVHMNGELVLRKARGLLYQFRQMTTIPCTLQGLCETCGPGMWDSGHVPVVQCVGHNVSDAVHCPSIGDASVVTTPCT